MRRCGFVLALSAIAIAACSQSKPSANDSPANLEVMQRGNNNGPSAAGLAMAGSPTIQGAIITGGGQPSPIGGGQPPPTEPIEGGPGDPDQQAKYDAALGQALELRSEQKWTEALAAFEAANAIRSTEITRLAIARLKLKIDLESSGEQTAANIRAVLDDGRADEASKLASQALHQFGETESLPVLLRLKREADSLIAVEVADRKTRFDRFRAEYEEALRSDNKRGAAAAIEQALLNSDDADLKSKAEALQRDIAEYDRLRAQATEMSKDPSQLDNAIESLQEAKKIWDTLAVNQEIDNLLLAQQNRRERLSIAEFEVRGEVGLPQAGAFIADELLPTFKTRYELVDRGRLTQAIQELNIQGEIGNDDLSRREIERLTGIRYLVTGSITLIGGLTVHARIVDLQTGLIVQTAKIVAQDADELTRKLPLLAEELMMSDEQKLAVEKERAERPNDMPIEVEALKPDPGLELPPPPEPPLNEIPPPPVIPARLRAPPANMEPEQFVRRFDDLPPPPPPEQVLEMAAFPAARDAEMRRRSLFVALELGDNLFRRGRFREAMAHFEFAVNLFPDHRAVRLRVERCRPLLPPVVITPPMISRRLAILDFTVIGNPLAVPPYLSLWTPNELAFYLTPEYTVVDRLELLWWMGRLGISPTDLLVDPVARLYLGRALNVRYFLFGNIVQTASFDVTTHLLDAEYGFLASSARIHVQNQRELKLRLGDLAWLIKMSPEQRRALEAENAQWILIMNDLRVAEREQRFRDCIALAERGLRLRPRSVELQVILSNSRRRQRDLEIAQVRSKEIQNQHQLIHTHQTQLRDLAQATEAARWRAEQLAANRTAAEQQRRLTLRQSTATSMVQQGLLMLETKRFSVAIQLFEGASALQPNDNAIYQHLATARVRANEAARVAAAEEAARREADLRRRREAELIRAQKQLEIERQRRAEEELARRRLTDERDRREYDRLMDLAQKLSAQQKYDQAVSAAQKAKQLRPTPDAERMVTQLLIDLAKARAEQKGAVERAELERQLAAERQARQTAEAEAERNRQLYAQALAAGQQLLQQQKFDEAEEQFIRARKIHESDAVLTALRQLKSAKSAMAAKLAAANAEKQRLERENELLRTKLAEANAALSAQQHEKAVALFREAKKIAPSDANVIAGLARAEQFRERELAKAQRDGEEKSKRDTFQRLLKSGQTSLAAKKYEAATIALGGALKLYPSDATAKAALAEAESKMNADANAKVETKRKVEQYEFEIRRGRRFMDLKQYDSALQAFQEARRLAPGDAVAVEFVQEAMKKKLEADNLAKAEIQVKQAAAQKATDLGKAMNRFRSAIAAGNLAEARTAYTEASKIDANHVDVKNALGELRKLQDAAEAAKVAASQKEKQFNELMEKARAALTAKKYDEASSAVRTALSLRPNDSAAKTLQSQIANARASGVAMERDEKLRQLISQAQSAIAAKRFDDAGKVLDQASALSPRDAGVARLRLELQKAKAEMDGLAAMQQKRKDFENHISLARTAFTAKRFDDADKAMSAALKLFPQDAGALTLKRQIDEERKNAASMTQKRAEYARLIQQGRTALNAKKFADAARAFESALNLFPADAEATRGLADAKKGMNSPPPPMGKPAAYTRSMESGAAQEKAGRYDQAVQSYRAALRVVAGDAEAQTKADFCQFMVDGDKAMKARKFADARSAFESALRLFPNDANAKAALQRAKTAK